MSELSRRAQFLVSNALREHVVGGRLRLPQPAPGSDFEDVNVSTVVRLRATITESPTCNLSISRRDAEFIITIPIGWLCSRWCSAYQLLKAAYPGAASQAVILEPVQPDIPFDWPESVPGPTNDADPVVAQTNQFFPWLVSAAVLHEIGHAVNASKASGPALELKCDRFSALYLLGTSDFEAREVRMFAIATWLCCICSESLTYCSHFATTHPNPVERLQAFLREFVPRDTTIGNALWMMCLGFAIRIARSRDRVTLDVLVLKTVYDNFDRFLSDLAKCW
jgi:hypothetical protein